MSASRVGGVVALAITTVAALAPAAGVAPAAAVPDGSAVQLPAPAAIGQRAASEAVIQTVSDGGPVTVVLATSSTVTDVGGDGSYTSQSTIESVQVTDAPASADVNSWGFDDLEGDTFLRTYAATGTPLSFASRSVDAQSLVVDAVSMVAVGFPESPVAVGESWVVAGTIVSDEITFAVTYQCRLSAVTDGAYSIDVSYADGFSAAVDGGLATGTISGAGTLSGSLGNPLIVWGRLNQTIDGVLTVGNSATPMRKDTSVTLSGSGV